MIIRIFRARARAGKQAEWKAMVRELSIPWLETQRGRLGYFPGEPMDSDQRDFVMVSLWKDVESLRRALGENWTDAFVLDEEVPLVEEMSVHHYQASVSPGVTETTPPP